VALCAFLAFLPNLGSVKALGFGPRGFTIERIVATVEETKLNLDLTRERMDRFIFLGMPRPIYFNLKRLAESQRDGRPFGPFEASEGFKQQLRVLRDSGYISTKGRLIGQLTSDQELSEFAEVTPLGLEFIA
jgi:hypothetical protein